MLRQLQGNSTQAGDLYDHLVAEESGGGRDHKICIVSQFTSMLDIIILQRFEGGNHGACWQGPPQGKDKDPAGGRFWKGMGVPVFLS